MNSEFSPTPEEELEAQITALLLGELPKEEASALRERIAADPALRKLHTQIGMTIGLVKEAIISPQSAEIAAPETLRLSEERREKLLASFKVVKVPGREVRIDFKSWGALAAMLAGLLSFSYWMLGAFSARERYSVNQLAAVEDSKPALTTPRDETRRLVTPRSAPAAAEPARGEILVSGSKPQESAPQDVRFRKEVGQIANAPVADGRPVEENRLSTRIELPKVGADTEIPSTSLAHDPAGIVVFENSDQVGTKPEGAPLNFRGYGGFGGGINNGQPAAGRGLYDQSAAGQASATLAGPAASSSTLAFGIEPTPAKRPEIELKDLEQNLPTPMEIRGVNGVVSDQQVNLTPGTDAMPVGGESQIAQQDSRQLGWSFATEQLGEREISLKQDKGRTHNISENFGEVDKSAKGKSETVSLVEADHVLDDVKN